MNFTADHLLELMRSNEDEHLEFKEAKSSYEFEELVKYCAALANERGGKFILGVTNRRPRRVVGSNAFQDLERTKLGIVDRLRLRVDAEIINHPDGRVVVFHVPSRPIGMPIGNKGAFWMRSGESLVPMTPDVIRRIFDEAGPDFSAELCVSTTLQDLDPVAISKFRDMWRKKSDNPSLQVCTDEQLLLDAELMNGGKITYAGLILLGTDKALASHLSNAEVVFEYRSSESSIPYQQRKEYRRGFLLWGDDLWSTINLRNEIQHYQDGLFMRDIPTFNEGVVREAVLNAVCHRDYKLQGSVFIRQIPKRIEIESPGGFPPGVNAQNILNSQSPRNRRLAEALAKCGLVERSGQGADRMFAESIRDSKPRPDFTGTDDCRVRLNLLGEVQNPGFLRFLEKVAQEGVESFTVHDLVVLDNIQREEPVPVHLKGRLSVLLERGVIERTGRGKGSRPILSRRFYAFLGKQGTYTRKRGLDRAHSKALLHRHIQDSSSAGARLQELVEVLPLHTRDQVQKLLGELKKEGSIILSGKANSARWFSTSTKVAPN